MKKIIYSLIFVMACICGACEDDLPQASWDLHEVENLAAAPLDASVKLSWSAPSEVTPSGYFLEWTPSSSAYEGGSMTLESTVTEAIVENLINKIAYTFTVQAVYGNQHSGKVSVKSTPVSSLVPPTNIEALAGSEKAKITWIKPLTSNVKGYKITVEPGNKVINVNDASIESYIISGLQNETEYTVSLQAVYDKGDSEAVTTKVTPGKVDPIVGYKPYVWTGEALTLSYNDMYFMGNVASVSWNFGDGTVTTENSCEKTYSEAGIYTISVEITNADQSRESAEVEVIVVGTAWNSSMGYVKASNPVFSWDGNTFYLPTANKVGDLNAFNTATGEKKWTFKIADKITYGGGAAVASDGIIYQGVRNGKLYAIYEGNCEWEYDTQANNKNLDCFPAVTSDGSVVYILDGDNVLHAINTANGSTKWKKPLEGTANKAGAVAIDRNGHIYAGTRSYIYAFDTTGELLWQVAASVTEIGSFALNAGTLYAAQTGGAGVVAVNTQDGQIKWTCAANGDAYAPIVGKDGTVYFVDKVGKSLYAVSAEGSLQWKFNGDAALTYCFPVLDNKGIVYFGTSKGQVFAVDGQSGEEVWHLDAEGTGDNAKVMAGLSVGPDQKLYVAYIGGSLKAISIAAGPETTTWSCRGGNIHGTNQY